MNVLNCVKIIGLWTETYGLELDNSCKSHITLVTFYPSHIWMRRKNLQSKLPAQPSLIQRMIASQLYRECLTADFWHRNYREWLKADFLQGENKCPTAEQNGVSILHGNALAFVKVKHNIHALLFMYFFPINFDNFLGSRDENPDNIWGVWTVPAGARSAITAPLMGRDWASKGKYRVL